MGRLSVLDCTLRDGGYCNQWKFGFNNAKQIVNGLVEADIDIIECGFLTNKVSYDIETTKFNTVEQISNIIPADRQNKMFVCMINYGEYNVEDLPEYDASSVDGIRVAFNKKDMIHALQFCSKVKDKGYKVFVQAMVSLSYSDEEFLNLISRVNTIEPYSFYIVDSFGVMKGKDLIRLFYMVEHNLKKTIIVGYHSHNNMQLSYSNAQALVDIKTNRQLIIDSSVFGMGRGAGNLNTELFVEYLNDNFGTTYNLKPLLSIIDEILNSFYQQNYWGYSLPNYLSAKHNAHPNYAGYLDGKKTLTVENMNDIFSMMDDAKKTSFDKTYIEELYMKYMAIENSQETHLAELENKIRGKEVLIIAPGRSSVTERDKIISCISSKDVISISINFDYTEYDCDYIFVSNLRRFRKIPKEKRGKCIVTSNIPVSEVFLKTKYKDLVNDYEAVRDNAGMMLVKFLIALGAKKVLIAGLDGYSADPTQNFADSQMNFYTQRSTYEAMNEGMISALKNYRKEVEIEYITSQKYVII